MARYQWVLATVTGALGLFAFVLFGIGLAVMS